MRIHMSRASRRKKGNNKKYSTEKSKNNKKFTWDKLQLFRNKTVQLITFIITIGTVLSLYNVFSPNLSIVPYTELDSGNIYKTVFEIKNEGNYPVYNLDISSRIKKIETNNRSSMNDFILKYKREPINKLLPSESTSYMTPEIFKMGKYSYGDIVIIVSYRPSFWPLNVVKSHRFITAKNINGTLKWVPKALAE
jgi:hypothetical protein